MATYDLTSSVPAANSLAAGDILNCPYSGAKKEITLPKGKYKLEVWGAQGGSYNTSYGVGGKGGYSVGTITLNNEIVLYLYSGGKGSYGTSTTYTTKNGGGFNGGAGASYRGGAGGGGSDIRIGSDSLYARVIVAGGGGGAYSYNSTYKANGGAGGGTSGVNGSYYSSTYGTFVGKGGTQTAGGASNTAQTSGNYNGAAGTFGSGGTSGAAYTTSYYSNGAGGGGWYGGSGADCYSSISRTRAAGGGGGSGYVYTSSTATNYPSGCLLNPEYYLADASTAAGNTTISLYEGGTGTGNSGNGACRITVIEIHKDENDSKNLYIKTGANSSLPSSGYIELPYIESSGTQYIDTGFKPNNNTGIEIDFQYLSGDVILSAWYNGSNECIFVQKSGEYLQYGYGTNNYITNIKANDERIYLRMFPSGFSIDNKYAQMNNSVSFTATMNLLLFTFTNSATSVSNFTQLRLYKCKIYDNKTLIRNYIPALRISDAKAGLYDLVNNVFYPDAAGGNFIYNRNNYLDNNITFCLTKGLLENQASSNYKIISNTGVTIAEDSSFYFNGSSYLTIDDNTTLTEDTDWTIDWWEYPTATPGYGTVFDLSAASGSYSSARLGYTTSEGGTAVGYYLSSNNTSWDIAAYTACGTREIGKWKHRAFVRHGSNFYIFENGILKATDTNAASLGSSTGTVYIGRHATSTSGYFTGYLRNFRISKVAHWTSNFTPPNLETDYGTNYAKIQESYIKISPTTHTSQYSGYTLLPYIEKSTGTEYIDTGFKPNQNTRVIIDFEFTKNTTNQEAIFGGRNGYQSNMFSLFTKANNIGFQNDYGSIDEQNNICPSTGRLLIDKNKNVFSVNNRIIHTHTTASFTSGQNLLIGSSSSDSSANMAASYPSYMKIYYCKVYDNGTLIRDYIPAMRNSDLKIGLYDKKNKIFYPDASGGNFSGNTLDADASTKVLLNGYAPDAINGLNITKINSTVINVKFLNDTSLYFNNSLLKIDPYNYVDGTNDFTVDWWEYPTSLVSGSAVFQAGTDYGGLLLAYLSTATDGSGLYAYGGTNTTTWDMINGIEMGTVKLNKWTHRAVSRRGNNFYFFENGKLINTTTSSGSLNSTKHQIGGYTYQSGTKYFIGYINSFRISNTARWTSDFIPPTQIYGTDWRKIKEIYIKRDPSTAEQKMSQYDTNIYTESDGSKWIRIFHHNNPASYFFASTDDFTRDVYKDANRWASLYLLKDLDVKELMIKQCLTSGATVSSFRWYQPKNPIDSTWNDDAQGNCTFHSSYTAPSADYGGLHLHQSNTYIACHNATQSNWFGAIGSWAAHNSGSPGYNGTTITTGYIDLYIPYKEPQAWVKI